MILTTRINNVATTWMVDDFSMAASIITAIKATYFTLVDVNGYDITIDLMRYSI